MRTLHQPKSSDTFRSAFSRRISGLNSMLIHFLWSVGAPTPYDAPPMYRIHATSLYDAGLQQGKLAGERIRGWLASPEMIGLFNYTASDGSAAFAQLKIDNGQAFPELVKELAGVADGANVPIDQIWTATMINELESLRSPGASASHAGHCSDLYAVPSGGFDTGFAHGHNEDWPGPIAKFWYFASYHALPGADFASCAGVVYPGGLVGWASSWNAKGIYLTQNSLFPKRNLPGGLASAFVQRAALCGAGGATTPAASLNELQLRLSAQQHGVGWSSAASINIVSMHERRMANLEVHLDKHAGHEVVVASTRGATYSEAPPSEAPPSEAPPSEAGANYSHFNMFKELEVGVADDPGVSTVHRQARVDALSPVRNAADIAARLSDDADPLYPIFRNMTLHTLILDGPTGELTVWCCGRRAATDKPSYRWNLLSFFSSE